MVEPTFKFLKCLGHGIMGAELPHRFFYGCCPLAEKQRERHQAEQGVLFDWTQSVFRLQVVLDDGAKQSELADDSPREDEVPPRTIRPNASRAREIIFRHIFERRSEQRPDVKISLPDIGDRALGSARSGKEAQ